MRRSSRATTPHASLLRRRSRHRVERAAPAAAGATPPSARLHDEHAGDRWKGRGTARQWARSKIAAMWKAFPNILPEASVHTIDELDGVVIAKTCVLTTALSMVTFATTLSAQKQMHWAAAGSNSPGFGHGFSNSFGNNTREAESATMSIHFRKLEGA